MHKTQGRMKGNADSWEGWPQQNLGRWVGLAYLEKFYPAIRLWSLRDGAHTFTPREPMH